MQEKKPNFQLRIEWKPQANRSQSWAGISLAQIMQYLIFSLTETVISIETYCSDHFTVVHCSVHSILYKQTNQSLWICWTEKLLIIFYLFKKKTENPVHEPSWRLFSHSVFSFLPHWTMSKLELNYNRFNKPINLLVSDLYQSCRNETKDEMKRKRFGKRKLIDNESVHTIENENLYQ